MGTMGLIGSLLAGRSGSTTVVECRRCGTTLDSGDAQCPMCDCQDVAEFDVA